MKRAALALRTALGTGLIALIAWSPAVADGGVTFTDIAEGGGAGITFSRTASPRDAIRSDILNGTPISVGSFLLNARASSPQKAHGGPGIAVFDYDNDGDLDIYVTNGPGSANSLYASQLADSGSMTFVDQGTAAGVGATSQDSSGVCYGDIDNDGDHDLYVLGTGESNLLFENNGDGTFTDITTYSGAGGQDRHPVACSFGDVDNDGLLDLVVANTYGGCDNPLNPLTGENVPCTWTGDPDDPAQTGWEHRQPVFGASDTYSLMEHNILLVNQGGNQFVDDSAASGIESVSGMSGPGLSGAAFTWAIAMYDYDGDGNIDIHSADNLGSAADPVGLHRMYNNDGLGNFTEKTGALNLDTEPGGWMGVAPADFNCDGTMDFFATNLGSYLGGPTFTSRWYFQDSDGTYYAPGVGDLLRTPFGWGTSAFDYDNDGDDDIIYHGSVDILNLVMADNPGTLLRNDGECSGTFSYDDQAIQRDHLLRTVHGVATGDLNDDGFFDMLSVSSINIVPTPTYLPAWLLAGGPIGSPFDDVSRFQNVLTSRAMPGFVVPVSPFPGFPDGDLSVEINSADNGNGWAKVRLLGSAGTLAGGTVNRDGIGATVQFTPDGGNTQSLPVLGGSSYASQNALEVGFGLGDGAQGTVDVLWPGGVRNRLYAVGSGERILFPHIPCSYDGSWSNFGQYNSCVMQALNTYKDAGLITDAERNRFRDSAWQAYQDAQ
ncbi:MAG: CRTAC1 family protein [Acidobacteriota bacterium]|jgi:hypothetical protein